MQRVPEMMRFLVHRCETGCHTQHIINRCCAGTGTAHHKYGTVKFRLHEGPYKAPPILERNSMIKSKGLTDLEDHGGSFNLFSSCHIIYSFFFPVSRLLRPLISQGNTVAHLH